MRFSTLILYLIARLGQSLISGLRTWTKPITENLLAGAVTDVTRSRRDLFIENALLRQQLLVLNRQVKRRQVKSGRLDRKKSEAMYEHKSCYDKQKWESSSRAMERGRNE